MASSKREHEGSDAEDDWIGPLPSEAASQKKQRGKFNFPHQFSISKCSLKDLCIFV